LILPQRLRRVNAQYSPVVRRTRIEASQCPIELQYPVEEWAGRYSERHRRSGDTGFAGVRTVEIDLPSNESEVCEAWLTRSRPLQAFESAGEQNEARGWQLDTCLRTCLFSSGPEKMSSCLEESHQ